MDEPIEKPGNLSRLLRFLSVAFVVVLVFLLIIFPVFLCTYPEYIDATVVTETIVIEEIKEDEVEDKLTVLSGLATLISEELDSEPDYGRNLILHEVSKLLALEILAEETPVILSPVLIPVPPPAVEFVVDSCHLAGNSSTENPLKLKVQPMVSYDMYPHLKGGDIPLNTKGVMGVPITRLMAQSGCSSRQSSMFLDVPHSPGGYGICMGWDHECDSGIRGSAILSGERNHLLDTSYSSIESGKENTIVGGEYNTILGGEGNTIQDGKHITILHGDNQEIIGGPETDNTVFMNNVHIHGTFSLSERVLTWEDFYGLYHPTPGVVHTHPMDYLIVIDIASPAEYVEPTQKPIIVIEKGKPGQQLMLKVIDTSFIKNIRKTVEVSPLEDEDNNEIWGRDSSRASILNSLITIQCPMDESFFDEIRADVKQYTYEHWLSSCENATDPCRLDLTKDKERIYIHQCFATDGYRNYFTRPRMITKDVHIELDILGTIHHVIVSINIETEEGAIPFDSFVLLIWSEHVQQWLVL